MIWVRQHKAGPDTVLAMADKELMGQRFEQDELVLEITEFYKGELCESKKAAELGLKVLLLEKSDMGLILPGSFFDDSVGMIPIPVFSFVFSGRFFSSYLQ